MGREREEYLYSREVRLLLVGNYGVGNLGDEALKEYFLRVFPEAQWQVVSASPQEGELPRLPLGFRSLFTPWWKTLRALERSDGVVFGGGTLFTDLESSRACFLWGWHAFVAWVFRRPFFLVFQGVGPFRTGVGRWCARWALRHAALVSVRDDASLRRVQSFKLNKKIIQTFDPVISIVPSHNPGDGAQNVLIIIPRKNSGVPFRERARQLSKNRAWEDIIILSLQPDDRSEQEICRALQNVLGENARVVPVRAFADLVCELFVASFVFSQRYHGALVALALDKECEVLPQGAEDKLAELIGRKHVPALRSLVEVGEEALRAALSLQR